MDTKTIRSITDYVYKHKEEYIDLLKRFCSQPCVSATNTGLKEMSDIVSSELKSLGADPVSFYDADHPIILGTLDYKKKRTLLVYNHYDVVPTEPDKDWNTPPFEPTIIDDRIYARGVADNKGSMLSRYCAIDLCQKLFGELPVNLKILVEGQEEIGSPQIGKLVQEHYDLLHSDGIIWEGGGRDINDGPLQVSLGVKGAAGFELRCRCAGNDMHSMYAAIVPNPVWRIIKALSLCMDEKCNIKIPYIKNNLMCYGKAELDSLKTFKYDENGILNMVGRTSFIKGLTGENLKEQLFLCPSFNIQGLHSGYEGDGAKAVLPAEAICKMDIRLVAGQNADDFFECLRKYLDDNGFTDIEIVRGSDMKPYRGGADSMIAQAIINNVEAVYGMPPSVYINMAGATGMGRFCEKLKTPAVCFGVYNDDSRLHAPNENIKIDDYLKGIILTAAVFCEFGCM